MTQTINLNNPRRRTGITGYLDDMTSHALNRWYDIKQHPVLATLATIGLIAVISIFWPRSAAPVAPVRPINRVVIATPTPAMQPVSNRETGPTLDRAVIAYDAPQGNVMDALEVGRGYRVLARSGNDWTQIRLAGGPDVWVRSDKLVGFVPDVATAVPTSAPPEPQREYVYVSLAAPVAAEIAPTVAPLVDAPQIYADACAGQETKDEGGYTWVCAVGESDGQIYWLQR